MYVKIPLGSQFSPFTTLLRQGLRGLGNQIRAMTGPANSPSRDQALVSVYRGKPQSRDNQRAPHSLVQV